MSPIVSIIMGSTSDLPVMEKAAQLLNDLHVPFEMNALSAHRTPEAVEEFAKGARQRGIKVIIAAAGMAALFCGVTNCPITAMLISFELFGFSGVAYYLIAISISYSLSGYYSLYKDQTIIYSKYKARYINRKTS